MYKTYILDIKVDGVLATFKVAALDDTDARKRCFDYYHDKSLPAALHKHLEIIQARQEPWKVEGFPKK